MSAVKARELIDTYERIQDLTRWMLQAAQRGDWDRLVDLEHACRAEVECLAALGANAPVLPRELQVRKAQIIRSVLADDAEIRRITEPGMSRLEQLIGTSLNQRRLADSYDIGP